LGSVCVSRRGWEHEVRGKHKEGRRTCSPHRRGHRLGQPLRWIGEKTPAAKSIFIEWYTCSAREKWSVARGGEIMYIREGMGGTTASFSSIPVITRSPVLRARKWDLCQALTCTSMHRTRPPRRSAKKIYSCQRATGGVGGVAVSGAVVGYGTARTTQPTLPGPFLPRGAGALENGGGL